MFVDASAMTAILADEHDACALLARLQNTRRRITSPLAAWGTTLAVARILGLPVQEAREAVEGFMRLAGIDMVEVTPDSFRVAIEAYDRYGKSGHPAALNFGDCFAYASA